MNTVTSQRLVGFFRPVWIGAGFAIPLFGANKSLAVQQTHSDEVIGFRRCTALPEEIRELNTVHALSTSGKKLEPPASSDLMRAVGDPALFAFQITDKSFIVGTRQRLGKFFREHKQTLDLESDPYLAIDIAEFIGDSALLKVSRLSADRVFRKPRQATPARVLTGRVRLGQKSIGRGGQPAIYAQGAMRGASHSSAPTKSDILYAVSKDTGLSRGQVAAVFDSLNAVIEKSLKRNGMFTLPGLAKVEVVKRPATKAREGVNPFTGEKMVFKAKPVRKKVQVKLLNSLIRQLK